MLFNKFWPTFILVLLLSIVMTSFTYRDVDFRQNSQLLKYKENQ